MNIERKRRPYVHTVITNDYEAPSSAVELKLTRHGVVIFGYYDHYVGIESLVIPWAEFDAERAKL